MWNNIRTSIIFYCIREFTNQSLFVFIYYFFFLSLTGNFEIAITFCRWDNYFFFKFSQYFETCLDTQNYPAFAPVLYCYYILQYKNVSGAHCSSQSLLLLLILYVYNIANTANEILCNITILLKIRLSIQISRIQNWWPSGGFSCPYYAI